jgi:hypothetical protein
MRRKALISISSTSPPTLERAAEPLRLPLGVRRLPCSPPAHCERPSRDQAATHRFKIDTYPTDMLSPETAEKMAVLAALVAGGRRRRALYLPRSCARPLGYTDYNAHATRFIVGGQTSAPW